MKRKKVLAVLLVLAMMMSLGACASQETSSQEATSTNQNEEGSDEVAEAENAESADDSGDEKKYTFGVLNVSAVYSYYQATLGGIEQQAEAMGVDLIVLDSQDDVGTEISNLESLITQGVDAILLINVGETDGGQCVDIAEEAGIPLIAVSRECSGSVPLCSIVTNANTAQLFADDMAEQLGGEGKVAEVQGTLGVSNVTLRHDALMNTLENNPELELVDSQVGDFDPATAQTVAMDILTANPDLDAFYVHDDGSAMGVIEAVKSLGREDTVKIYSTGGDPSAIAAIEAGELESTWAILTGWEGACSVYLAVQYLEGAEIPEEVETPSMGITAENVADYPDDTVWTSIDWPDFPFPDVN